MLEMNLSHYKLLSISLLLLNSASMKASPLPLDSPLNHLPFVSGINGTSNTVITFCEDELKCFTINSFDSDLSDSVFLSWDSTIKGANFSVEKGKKHPKATFCWKPDSSQLKQSLYSFNVIATDNFNPPGITKKNFKIYIKPRVNATYTTLVDKCGYVTFKAKNTGTTPILYYYWYIAGIGRDAPFFGSSPNPVYIKNAGTYKYYLEIENAEGCVYKYFDSFIIKPHADIILPNDTTVKAGTIMLLTGTIKSAIPPYSISWNQTPSSKDSIYILINQNITYKIFLSDASGCRVEDSIVIKCKQPPNPDISSHKILCVKKNQTLLLDANFYEKKCSYKWVKLNPVKILGTTFRIQFSDTGKVVLYVTDSLNTTTTDTIEIRPGIVPKVSFTFNYEPSGKVSFFPTDTAANYFWDFGDGNTSFDKYPIHIYKSNKTYLVSLTVSDSTGCDSTIVHKVTITNLGTDIGISEYEPHFTLHTAPGSPPFIEYSTNINSKIRITIVDITGREIFFLSNQNTSAGTHQFRIPQYLNIKPGMYLLRFNVNGFESTCKLVL